MFAKRNSETTHIRKSKGAVRVPGSNLQKTMLSNYMQKSASSNEKSDSRRSMEPLVKQDTQKRARFSLKDNVHISRLPLQKRTSSELSQEMSGRLDNTGNESNQSLSKRQNMDQIYFTKGKPMMTKSSQYGVNKLPSRR